MLHLSRYIHLNPVAAGLVSLPEQWVFSSYLEHVGKRDGTLPESGILLSEFASREAYRKFVMGGDGQTDTLIDHLTIDSDPEV